MKLDRAAIADAAERLTGRIVATPVQPLESEELGLPRRLTLKLENLQHSGCLLYTSPSPRDRG